MADEIDAQDIKDQLLLDASVRAISNLAASIPKGVEGECEACGEHSLRLVKGHNPAENEIQLCCASCRDKHQKARNAKFAPRY